ncbi:MAG: hypothetical protein NTY15_06865 [Planctomycetota bacterium]|nr:hypothetical protein [Planctomycetota bacterium]
MSYSHQARRAGKPSAAVEGQGTALWQKMAQENGKSLFFLVNCESFYNVATACLTVFVDLIVKDALLDSRIAVYSQSGLERSIDFGTGYVPSKIQQLT